MLRYCQLIGSITIRRFNSIMIFHLKKRPQFLMVSCITITYASNTSPCFIVIAEDMGKSPPVLQSPIKHLLAYPHPSLHSLILGWAGVILWTWDLSACPRYPLSTVTHSNRSRIFVKSWLKMLMTVNLLAW
jgi:hypothetical protein